MLLLVEGERLAQQDVVALHFHRSQAAGLERFVARLERAVAQCIGRIDREIAQVHRVPQHDALGDALMNVVLVLVGQTQADDFHIVAAGLLDGLGGARHGRRADRHDQFHVRIGIENGVGFVRALCPADRRTGAGPPF